MRLGFRRGGARLGLLGLLVGSVLLTLLVGSSAATPFVVPSGGCVRPANGPNLTCTFDYTGAVESWTVPSGVSSATFDVFGASGGFGDPGHGRGGEVQADVPVTPGDQLDVTVGQFGEPDGAFGGGGAAGAGAGGPRTSGGGGGASRVERAGTVLLVAGGGGGSTGALGGKGGATDSTGDGQNNPAGAGGGKSGAAGGAGGVGDVPNSCSSGQTPVVGGAGSASSGGIGGTGGDAVGPFNAGSPGGGGGGGYVGGGGGGGGSICDSNSVGFGFSGGGGGGGGSSFADGTASGVTMNSGVRPGNGVVTVTFSSPDTDGLPGVTIDQASGQADPTGTPPIKFTAEFSEAVTGFTSADVSITGDAGGTKSVTVTETAPLGGTTYEVSVSGMTTTGTVIATVLAGGATGADFSTNAASTSTDNTVTFDTAQPTVTINQGGSQLDPTSASPIIFDVTFSEDVSGFDASDVDLSASTAQNATAQVSGGPATYTVTVSGMTTNGIVVASIPAGAATDAANNGNTASTSTDNTVTFEGINATPTATVTNGQCSPTNMASGAINLTLFDADGDVLTLTFVSGSNTTLVPNANVVLGGSGNNRTLTVTGAAKKSGSATLTFNLSDGTVTVPVVVTVKIGTAKNETLNGTTGIDMIFGLAGKNTLNGDAGNDLLCGGNSNDTLSGGNGNDILDGGNGDDVLSGGNNNDILRGASGNDTLTGGTGADSFSGGSGTDTATDFTVGDGDTSDGS